MPYVYKHNSNPVDKYKQATFTLTPLLETQKPHGDGKAKMEIDIHCTFVYKVSDTWNNGTVSCWIPDFDVYFYAAKEDAERVASACSGAFLNHYGKDGGVAGIVRQLKIMGFEPTAGSLGFNTILKGKHFTTPISFTYMGRRPVENNPVEIGTFRTADKKMAMAF